MLVILVYVGTSVQASWTITRWQHAQGQKVEDLVLGVEEVHQASMGRSFCWTGSTPISSVAVSRICRSAPKRFPGVYLAPGSEARIQAAPDLLSKYVLPQSIARRALARTACGSLPLRRPDAAQRNGACGRFWTEEEPRFVNLGDPVFGDYVGSGWREAADGDRRMDRSGDDSHRCSAQLRRESVYRRVSRPAISCRECASTALEAPVALARRDNDLSEFRATLPPQALAVETDGSRNRKPETDPLLFGYAEVR